MPKVRYDQKSKVTAYSQNDPNWKSLKIGTSTIGATGCALTCCGMLVKKSPKVLHEAGFTTGDCDWHGIAKKYSKTYTLLSSSSLSTLASTLATKPAIVNVNSSNSHFVVVTQFDGNTDSPTANDFICYDPWKNPAEHIPLDMATRYSSVASIRTMS